MNTLKHCLNPKVLLGVAAVAVALYFVVPGAALLGALPLLILLVCPLSMVVMMWGMGKMGGTSPVPATAAAAPLRPGETDAPNS
jgi:hypothetical protein